MRSSSTFQCHLFNCIPVFFMRNVLSKRSGNKSKVIIIPWLHLAINADACLLNYITNMSFLNDYLNNNDPQEDTNMLIKGNQTCVLEIFHILLFNGY